MNKFPVNLKLCLVKKHVISWFLTISLLLGGSVSSVTAQQDDDSRSDFAGYLWAAGDETSLFLVLRQPVQQEQGFKILQRNIIDYKFRAGPGYQGLPAAAVVYGARLLVFLVSGRCHSYDLYSAPRTEAILPEAFNCLGAAVSQNHIYVLARAKMSAEINFWKNPSLPSGQMVNPDDLEDANQTAASNQNDSLLPAAGGTVGVNPGEYFVLIRSEDLRWYSLTEHALPIKLWDLPGLAVLNHTIYLFGIDPEQHRAVVHYRLADHKVSEPLTLPINNVRSLTVLNVNRQVRLLIAVSPAEGSAQSKDPSLSAPAQFRIGWPTVDNWQFSELLQITPGRILTAELEKVCFAACGQNLAAFLWLSPRQVHFGIYSPSGDIVTDLTHSVIPLEEGIWPFLPWFFGPQAGIICMAVTLVLLYWRRQDAFSEPKTWPEFIPFAPLPRRLIAFSIDTIPLSIVLIALYPDLLNNLNVGTSFKDQTQKVMENPLLFKSAAVFFLLLTGYLTLFEALFGATLGKFVMNLVVLNDQGAALTLKQALIRNLLRLLEFQIGIVVLVLVFITRRRQRIGDLVARTVVVLKTPDLKDKTEEKDEKG